MERIEEASAEPAQPRIALCGSHKDVLVSNIGYRPNDRQSIVEALHADFAVNGGDAILSGLLGLLQRRDGAAKQQQRLRDIALCGLEPPFVPVLSLGEQRTHVLLEHGERRVRESGSQAGHLGHEDGRPPRRFEIADVLCGHDRTLVDQSTEAGGMYSSRAFGTDPKSTRVFEPVE